MAKEAFAGEGIIHEPEESGTVLPARAFQFSQAAEGVAGGQQDPGTKRNHGRDFPVRAGFVRVQAFAGGNEAGEDEQETDVGE